MPNNVVTAFEQAHFDATSCRIISHGVDFTSLLGRALTPDEIVHLSGAFKKSTIDVYNVSNLAFWGKLGIDQPPLGIYFGVSNPDHIDGRNWIGIFADATRKVYGIYIKDVSLKKGAVPGLAAKMLARIVRVAQVLGVGYIRLCAAGGRTWPDRVPGERWGGYYAWPRFGFDMPIEQKTRQILPLFARHPRNLQLCQTVQDVMQKEGGHEFWRTVGDGAFMEFDLSLPTSASLLVLISYMTEKGI